MVVGGTAAQRCWRAEHAELERLQTGMWLSDKHKTDPGNVD